MSRNLRVSRPARNDLEGIWEYVAEESGIEAATRPVVSMTNAFSLFGKHPAIGRRRDELAPGVRSFPVGAFLIYYRQRKGAIEISRVLHAKRDQVRAWKKGPAKPTGPG